MKPIRIFRHIDCEGPAYFQTILESKQISFELIKIDEHQAVNTNLDNVSGLLFMGGSMSVNDPLDWIEQELTLIQNAIQRNIPVMGICLGSQLIARAMDATIYPGPCMEMGWDSVRCENNTNWTQDLPEEFPVFHWHGETFDLPNGATRIFENDRYKNQGFISGPHLALQFHLEMEESIINEWLRRYPEDLQRRCDKDNDARQIQRQTSQLIQALQYHASILFNRWLDGCLV